MLILWIASRPAKGSGEALSLIVPFSSFSEEKIRWFCFLCVCGGGGHFISCSLPLLFPLTFPLPSPSPTLFSSFLFEIVLLLCSNSPSLYIGLLGDRITGLQTPCLA